MLICLDFTLVREFIKVDGADRSEVLARALYILLRIETGDEWQSHCSFSQPKAFPGDFTLQITQFAVTSRTGPSAVSLVVAFTGGILNPIFTSDIKPDLLQLFADLFTIFHLLDRLVR